MKVVGDRTKLLVAFEIELDMTSEDMRHDEAAARVRSIIFDSLVEHGAPVVKVTALSAPSPNTYHPERRWLVK